MNLVEARMARRRRNGVSVLAQPSMFIWSISENWQVQSELREENHTKPRRNHSRELAPPSYQGEGLAMNTWELFYTSRD